MFLMTDMVMLGIMYENCFAFVRNRRGIAFYIRVNTSARHPAFRQSNLHV